MTSFNAAANAKTPFNGAPKDSIALSEILGVVGGVAGGLMVYAETGNVTAGVCGAIAGGVGGWGMGNFVAPLCNEMGAGTKVLTSTLSIAFGISCAGLGGAIGQAMTTMGGKFE